jgi:hypothetical protein
MHIQALVTELLTFLTLILARKKAILFSSGERSELSSPHLLLFFAYCLFQRLCFGCALTVGDIDYFIGAASLNWCLVFYDIF